MSMTITAITLRGESGRDYTVDADSTGSPRCTCPDHEHRERYAAQPHFCKHIRFVAERIGPMQIPLDA